jgi:hypothetical protein
MFLCAEAAGQRVATVEAELKQVRVDAETGALQKQLARERQATAETRHKEDAKYLQKRLRQAKKRARKRDK